MVNKPFQFPALFLLFFVIFGFRSIYADNPADDKTTETNIASEEFFEEAYNKYHEKRLTEITEQRRKFAAENGFELDENGKFIRITDPIKYKKYEDRCKAERERLHEKIHGKPVKRRTYVSEDITSWGPFIILGWIVLVGIIGTFLKK